MTDFRIVLDTNVLYAGLYSADGASHRLLRAVDSGTVRIVLSTSLLFEYEDVVRRDQVRLGLSDQDVEELLDSLCQISEHPRIYFLWRPCLADAKDDHILELAVAAGVDAIVTHNIRHFEPAQQFGIEVRTPRQMMENVA